MNIRAMYNKNGIIPFVKCCMVLIILFLSIHGIWATDNVININSPMPSCEVSVVAQQSVVLQPGFHATASSGNFNAKIGNINSVCPALPLAAGSGSVLQPVASETVNTSRSCMKVITPLQSFSDPALLKPGNSLVEEKYFDGLGRGNMTVLKNFSPGGQDLVSMVNFDGYGRLSNKWLPVPINSVAKPNADIVIQQAKNYYNDPNPYYSFNESFVDAKTYKPGAVYRSLDKSFKQGGQAMTKYDIKQYVVDEDNIILLELADENIQFSTYDVQQTIDEDGHVTIVFANFLGQIIMTRMADGENTHDTYYLYDDLGRLCYVLSPEASDRMSCTGIYPRSDINTSSSPLAQYAYAYTYDEAGRCVARKIPGRDWENVIYDKANQLAFTQAGNQCQSFMWTYYKYDNQGRPIQSGTTMLVSPEGTRTTYAEIKAEETYQAGTGYTSAKPLGSDTKLLTQQFYDSYDFLTLPAYSTLASNLSYSGSQGTKYSNIINNVDIALLGKPTGTWVAMLETIANPPTLLTALYYDDKGRVIQSNASNQLNGYDKNSYTYSFVGQMLSNTHAHSSISGSVTTNVTELYRWLYDKAGRMTSVRHKLNTQAEIVLDSLLYDETGRITRKILHGGMQAVDYAYNQQGQLKSLSSPAFTETLKYSDPDPDGTPLYNGSIASVQYGNGTGYRYTYDGLNRLKTADYIDVNNAANNGTFSEKIDEYDKNGNIKQLTRSGLARDQYNMTGGVAPVVKNNLDQLTMTYEGNQLQKTVDANPTAQYLSVGMADFADVQDAIQPQLPEYYYDANGNCTGNLNKGIAWSTYNILNRPQTIQMINGNKSCYVYDATGIKRRTEYYTAQAGIQVPLGDYRKELGRTYGVVSSSSWTDYCGNYVYVDGTLARILTSEGYVKVTGTNPANWRYAYNLTDHLGSSRAQLLSDPLSNATSKACTVVSTAEYYPLGMEIRRSDTNTSGTNPYLYGSNELERMHGLNLYEFPYRWYDYAVAGFTTLDPLAEKHYSESPYSYCGGDPVNRVDPTGLDWYIAPNGEYACWSSAYSNEATKNYKNMTYRNIGSTFTAELPNGVIISGYADCNYTVKFPGSNTTIEQQPQTGQTNLNIFFKDAQAQKLNYFGPLSQITPKIYDIMPFVSTLSLLSAPELTGLTIPEIKIEPMPGIEMKVEPIANDATAASDAIKTGDNDDFQEQGNSSWATVTLGFIATDMSIPEPTDAAWPKWVGYGVAATVAAAYIYYNAGEGNSSYPGPWSYTRPDPTGNVPFNNPPNGFDPNEPPSGLGTAAKWLIGGRLIYEMYDEYQQKINQIDVQPYIVPKDNTNVVQPQFIPYRLKK